jgi:hypothetical protein
VIHFAGHGLARCNQGRSEEVAVDNWSWLVPSPGSTRGRFLANRRRRGGLALLITCVCCSRPERPAEPPLAPAEVSLEQFQALRWLQGTWRGSEDGANPFFESYLFLNDSTILSFTYPDSTFAEANDTGSIVWAGSRITSANGEAAWVVTHFDTLTVRFDPLRNATTAHTWSRESRAAWTARLEVPGGGGVPPGRLYRMERVGS